jgi:uroporphyrinogen III methyltransferase / synthase
VTKQKSIPATVFLVGAGPGDPELLSLRAARALSDATVVVADADAAPIAERFAPEAELVLTVDGNGLPNTRAAKAKKVATLAKKGGSVVRLMSGDPIFDGSFADEAAALHKAEVHFDVIPPTSAISAASAFSGVPLTSKRSAKVVVLTEFDASAVPDYDSGATVVFTTGADDAAEVAAGFLAAGYPNELGIAVIRGGSTVEQRTLISTLGEVGRDTKAAKLAGPGQIIIGEGVGQRDALNWFETKPLFGWRVLIPRTKEQAGEVSARLAPYGAVGEEVPTISVEPPRTPQQMEKAIQGIVDGVYAWVVFTSANAVRAVRERLEARGLGARDLAGVETTAVGDKTAAAIKDMGAAPNLVPVEDQSSAGLIAMWHAYDREIDGGNNRVFLPRADIATETLVEGLTELGWAPDDITAYRTVRASPPPAPIREAIKTGGFDAVLFTSSSTVRNLVGIAGKPHATTVVACIGPVTAKTAEEHGLRVDVLATEPKIEVLVTELAEFGEQLRLAAAEAGEPSWRPSRKRATRRRSSR